KRMDVISLSSANIVLIDNTTSQVVPGNFVPSADRTVVVIQPQAPLKTNTQYYYYLTGATDIVGNAVNSGARYFVTGLGPDTVPPVVTQANPPAGATAAINVTLQFLVSKPINPITFNAATAVSLVTTTGNTAVAGVASIVADQQTITFNPTSNLAPNTSYTVKVGGFPDDLGNVITPFTGTFTTDNTGVADTVQPIVLSTVPVNAATNVATNSTITLNFSKPLNPLTVTARNVHIFIQQTGFTVAGTYSLNNTASAATVTFTPAAPVPASSKVFVQVNNV